MFENSALHTRQHIVSFKQNLKTHLSHPEYVAIKILDNNNNDDDDNNNNSNKNNNCVSEINADSDQGLGDKCKGDDGQGDEQEKDVNEESEDYAELWLSMNTIFNLKFYKGQ